MCSGRQSRPHLFHVVRKVCTKSGHVSTIPPVVKNNSHHGISTIKSDYPFFPRTAAFICKTLNSVTNSIAYMYSRNASDWLVSASFAYCVRALNDERG